LESNKTQKVKLLAVQEKWRAVAVVNKERPSLVCFVIYVLECGGRDKLRYQVA
jgi:hypothetical protein